MTVFKWEVEKGRQHLRRQFNRHMVNPINRFTFGKGIQHIGVRCQIKSRKLSNAGEAMAAPICEWAHGAGLW